MIAIGLVGLPMVMLGVDAAPRRARRAAFVAGAGIEVFCMGWNLAMQENIDDDMLSRAYSYDALGSFVAMPLGQLAWGPLGVAFGNSRVLVASGIAYAAICRSSSAPDRSATCRGVRRRPRTRGHRRRPRVAP